MTKVWALKKKGLQSVANPDERKKPGQPIKRWIQDVYRAMKREIDMRTFGWCEEDGVTNGR